VDQSIKQPEIGVMKELTPELSELLKRIEAWQKLKFPTDN